MPSLRDHDITLNKDQKSSYKAFENFQREEVNQKKIHLTLATVEYDNHIKGGKKGFLTTLKNQTTFFFPFVNNCHCLKEGLKTQPKSITFTSFINGPNIPNIILVAIEVSKMSSLL